MDTREKILTLDELPGLLGNGEWAVVAGLFDPLTIQQARRLAAFAETGRRIVAIVISQADALMTAEARASLVAALREVEAVAISDEREWRLFIPDTPELRIVEDAQGERERSSEFVQFVIERQGSGEAVGQKQ